MNNFSVQPFWGSQYQGDDSYTHTHWHWGLLIVGIIIILAIVGIALNWHAIESATYTSQESQTTQYSNNVWIPFYILWISSMTNESYSPSYSSDYSGSDEDSYDSGFSGDDDFDGGDVDGDY